MLFKSKDIDLIKSEFSCKRGDLTVRGLEYRKQGDALPIAIVSHGFMANRDTVKHYAIALAELGYAAFCFDFCGGCVMLGKSDGNTTDMSVLTETEDLLAVIQYAKSLPHTDETNILLMGCSQGGFVSALAAAKLGDEIKKLALFFPAFCIPDDARRGQMMFAKFDPNDIPDIIQCGPMTLGRCYVQDVIDMDPYKEILGFGGNVLIVHGTDDTLVNIDYSFRALSAYSKEKAALYGIEKAGHRFTKEQDKQATAYLLEFARL